MTRVTLLACLVGLVASASCAENVDLAEEDTGAGAAASSGAGATGSGNGGPGGANPGGAGGGGVGGSAGGGGTPGTGAGPVSLPECTADADCQLVDDCCTCEGIPADEPVEECLALCEVSMCTALGLSPLKTHCVGGSCVAGFDCTSLVACATVEPQCPPGEIAARNNGCWTDCVPATECAAVPSCDDCDLSTQTCVQYVAFSVSVHCLPRPDTCSGPADCACAGDVFCNDMYDACSGDSGILSCECTTC